MESTLPQVAATALFNISFAWVVGVLAARLWLMTQKTAWQQLVFRRLSLAMLAGLLACATGLFLSLWTESAMMGDVAWLAAWPAYAQMMTTTHYGHAGVAAMVLLVISMLAHRVLQRAGAGTAYLGIMAALFVLVAAARVTIGHAYEHGPLSVAAVAEWVHLLCMALWAGIVFVAGWLVLPSMLRRESAPGVERAAYLSSMSNWAAAAVAGIVATGACNAYRVLGSPRDLLEEPYGYVLLIKLLLVLVAIALGGFNRFFGLPACCATQPSPVAARGLGTVMRVLRIESLVLVLILLAAAMLANSAPPGH
jgi:putative copper resistance protein D